MTNDIIFIGEKCEQWRSLKERFPTAKRCSDFFKAQKTSMTKMFWAVWDDVIVGGDFDFSYQADNWSTDYVHIFKNGNEYDGIILCNKRAKISEDELACRLFPNKKEVDIQASTPKPYEVYSVADYEGYLAAKEKCNTEMFWMIPPNVDVNADFEFDFHVPKWDKQYTHIFRNGDSFDGIVLCSTDKLISRNEFEYSVFTNKKEVDIQASTPKPYNVFYIKNYQDYCAAYESSQTSMFWTVPLSVEVLPDFYFDFRVPKWDKRHTYVFKNGKYFDGIALHTTQRLASRNEFEYSFFLNRKEVEIQASVPKRFEVCYIDTYDDYLAAREKCTSSMLWIVPSNVVVSSDFEFDYQVHKQDENYVHVFKNDEYFDGIVLCPIDKLISRNEFNYATYINKKEVDVQASSPIPFDIVFISYNEPNADKNYERLLAIAPRAKRVHGVVGIHQAHIAAATQCSTDMFWVVDADAEIVDGFDFDWQVPKWEQDCVHVWRSKNPVNDLTYGYGGVKLLPTELTKQVDINSADMTTSISNKFKAVPEVSNVSVFNTDAFSSWRSAFRECTKLASKTIRGQIDDETRERLDVWCTVGKDRPFGDYAISGALSGREYGNTCVDSAELGKINDYNWLCQRFLESTDED